MSRLIFILISLNIALICALLGLWQLDRYNYKLEKNVTIGLSPKDFNLEKNFTLEQEYQIFEAKGFFDYSRQILVGPRQIDRKKGKFVFTIFEPNIGRTILVNRGFVEDSEIANLKTSGFSNNIDLKLMLRFEKGKKWFIPKNKPEKNSWIYVDLEEFSKKTGIQLANFYFTKMKDDNQSQDNVTPAIDQTYELYNPHLKYVYFWFILAGTVIIMMGIFLRQKNGKRKKM